jgi:hypothetical protein
MPVMRVWDQAPDLTFLTWSDFSGNYIERRFRVGTIYSIGPGRIRNGIYIRANIRKNDFKGSDSEAE